MAQFRQFLVVVLPALAAGFSLNVKPKERSQQRSAAEAAAVGCDDCGFSSLGLPSDAEKVSRTIDLISGRRLGWNHVHITAPCDEASDCCPNGGGVSDDGGSWSGESSGPNEYADKRVYCAAGCDTSCDDHGTYGCNSGCNSCDTNCNNCDNSCDGTCNTNCDLSCSCDKGCSKPLRRGAAPPPGPA